MLKAFVNDTPICGQCGNPNHEPHYRSCSTCRAKWRRQRPRKRPINLPFGFIAVPRQPDEQMLDAGLKHSVHALKIWRDMIAEVEKGGR